MLDHPATLGAQAQGSQFRSAAVAPNVSAHGSRLRMASFTRQQPVATSGPPSRMTSFAANVRTPAYAGRRISAAQPQALQQLLEAFLIHHGTY